MKTIAALLALLLFLPAVLRAADATASSDTAITSLREGLVSAFNAGDVDRLIGFLDPDVVVTWQNGEVTEGASGLRAYYDRMMKGDKPIVRTVTAAPEILGRHVEGDHAVSWGKLNDHFELTDGRDLPLDSRFTATLSRRGNDWRVTAFHVSANVFDNPVLSLAIKKVALAAGLAGAVGGLIVGLLVARLLWRPKSVA
jgi:ketosteroid isomerase-like protein